MKEATYHCPEDGLEFADDLWVLAFGAVFSNVPSIVREMPLCTQ